MSSIYALEPNTVGRAILRTTHGPLDLHFWSHEAPQTTRNFLQHALNGYYTDMPFHRVIPGILAQTGDPSGTGYGGEAATHPPPGVPCETHGRLRFRRRGLVAMVGDEEGYMRSQFFFTLGATAWLDGKHSIFGCVQGDSIYNLVTLGEREVEGFGLEGAPVLKEIEVVENPFQDVVARPRLRDESEAKVKSGAKTNAKRAVKSNKLLSFLDNSDSESGEDGDRIRVKVRKGQMRKSKEVKQTGTTNEKVDNKRTNEEVIGNANAEFERLKAQLTGPKQQGGLKRERSGENNKTDGKRRKANESETLGRLKMFEEKLRSLRSSGSGDRKEGWFGKGLKLGTQAMAEEYEVRIGGRKEGRDDTKRQHRQQINTIK